MSFAGKLKFNRRFFARLLVVLVFFGVGFSFVQVRASKITDNGETYDEFSPGATIGLGDPNDTAIHTTNNVEVARQNNGHVNLQPLNPEKITLGAWLIQKASDLIMWTVSSDLYEGVFFSEGAKRVLSFIWGVVRDFVNMFYLLVLIFLAITTILRVNKFSDKKLFFNVIVSAILVNFSLPITLAVIDFSNILMDFFATAIANTLHGKDIGTFMLKHSHYSTSVSLMDLVRSGVASMVQFVIEVAMAVMLFFTAISLLIRLIAYWVLIILSPLAFFTIALPNSDSFQEWKDKLLNYSFYGPMMLFFIWIALLLLAELGTILATVNGASKWASGETGRWLAFIVPYITVMYLLYYGHEKSREMSVKAGDTVTKIMDKGKDYAVKAGKGAAMIHPVGLVGGAGYVGGKFLGEAAKSKGMESKLFRNLWKEGREKSKTEFSRKAEYFGASANKRERMQMEDLGKEERDMKEKYGDLNVSTLKKIAKVGTDKEKKVAMLKLNREGKLKDEEFEKGMALGRENVLYKNSFLSGANKNNQKELIKYYTQESRRDVDPDKGDKEAKEFIREHIKTLLPEAQKIDRHGNPRSDEYIDRAIKRFVANNYDMGHNDEDENYAAAVTGAILSKMGNPEDIAKFINADAKNAEYARRHYKNMVSQNSSPSATKINKIMSNLNDVSMTYMRDAFVNNNRRQQQTP